MRWDKEKSLMLIYCQQSLKNYDCSFLRALCDKHIEHRAVKTVDNNGFSSDKFNLTQFIFMRSSKREKLFEWAFFLVRLQSDCRTHISTKVRRRRWGEREKSEWEKEGGESELRCSRKLYEGDVEFIRLQM
jgi:hypothetical protein